MALVTIFNIHSGYILTQFNLIYYDTGSGLATFKKLVETICITTLKPIHIFIFWYSQITNIKTNHNSMLYIVHHDTQ